MSDAHASPGLSDAEVEKLMTDATTEGVKAGIAAERSRIMAILSHPEAAGRDATARHLAFATEMTADQAGALLATLPKAAPVNEFAAGVAQGAGVPAEPEAAPVSDADVAISATKAALSKLLKR